MWLSKFLVNQNNLSLIRPEENLTAQRQLDFRFMAGPLQHPHIQRKKEVIIGMAGNIVGCLLKDQLISYSLRLSVH